MHRYCRVGHAPGFHPENCCTGLGSKFLGSVAINMLQWCLLLENSRAAPSHILPHIPPRPYSGSCGVGLIFSFFLPPPRRVRVFRLWGYEPVLSLLHFSRRMSSTPSILMSMGTRDTGPRGPSQDLYRGSKKKEQDHTSHHLQPRTLNKPGGGGGSKHADTPTGAPRAEDLALLFPSV